MYVLVSCMNSCRTKEGMGVQWLGIIGKPGVLRCIARGVLTIGLVQRPSREVFLTRTLVARGILIYTRYKKTFILNRVLGPSRSQRTLCKRLHVQIALR